MSGSHQGNTKNNRTKPQGHHIFILPANSHGNPSKEGKRQTEIERDRDKEANQFTIYFQTTDNIFICWAFYAVFLISVTLTKSPST